MSSLPDLPEIDRTEVPVYHSWEELYKQHESLEVRDIPGKGKGVIAKREYKVGEIVSYERANYYTNEDEEDDELYYDCVYYLFNEIINGDQQQMQLLLDLSSTLDKAMWKKEMQQLYDTVKDNTTITYDIVEKIVCIIHTNMFSLDLSSGYCLFLFTSRFNHSCQPNCLWHTVGDVVYITCIEPIHCNDEITIPYVFGLTRQNKVNYFKKYYGFECTCPYCLLNDDYLRCFKCQYCNGKCTIHNGIIVCSQCHKQQDENTTKQMIHEENEYNKMTLHDKIEYYFNSNRMLHDSHVCMIEIMRTLISKHHLKELELAKNLVQISKELKEQYKGRIYANALEVYAMTLLHQCTLVNPVRRKLYKQECLNSLLRAYEERCSLGMGNTSYALYKLKECYIYYNGSVDISCHSFVFEW